MMNMGVQDANNITFDVRKRATWKFVLFLLLTNGVYVYFWLWKFVKDFNKLQVNPKNKINYWLSISFLLFIDVLCLTLLIIMPLDIYSAYAEKTISTCGNLSMWVSIVIASSIGRHIEKYAQEKYQANFKLSGIATFFFSFAYINFVINSFEEKVTMQKITVASEEQK